MKKIISLFAILILTSAMDFAFADYELLVKSNCLACHYIDKRKYGPKLNEVAAKYANESDAAENWLRKLNLADLGFGVRM